MTTQQQKRPIKRLRAALVKEGFTKLGGYTEFKKTFALYIGREYGQRKIINAAIRLGFKKVVKSGKASIALPKHEKSSAVIKKNTKSPQTCVVLKKHLQSLFNAVTPEVRMGLMRKAIEKLPRKYRKAFIESLTQVKTGK